MSDGFRIRKYEFGDEFFKIDMETTLCPPWSQEKNGMGRIEFDQDDLSVRETIVDTKLCVGLIIDESGSMSGDKMHAAMDISLALSELMQKEFEGQDKAFPLFQPGAGDGVLGHAQRNVRRRHDGHQAGDAQVQDGRAGETGEKQVYLITDTSRTARTGST